jgi:rhodanese-related sulfurtransferase
MSARFLVPVAFAMLAAVGCNKAPTTDAGEKPAAATQAEEKEAFGRMSVDDVQAKLAEAKAGKAEFFVYDNNQKSQYEKGHVPGAKWVNFHELTEKDLPSNKEATLVFYCGNEQCTACHGGAKAALGLGFKHVYIMPAGIQGWEKAGKPTETLAS